MTAQIKREESVLNLNLCTSCRAFSGKDRRGEADQKNEKHGIIKGQ